MHIHICLCIQISLYGYVNTSVYTYRKRPNAAALRPSAAPGSWASGRAARGPDIYREFVEVPLVYRICNEKITNMTYVGRGGESERERGRETRKKQKRERERTNRVV